MKVRPRPKPNRDGVSWIQLNHPSIKNAKTLSVPKSIRDRRKLRDGKHVVCVFQPDRGRPFEQTIRLTSGGEYQISDRVRNILDRSKHLTIRLADANAVYLGDEGGLEGEARVREHIVRERQPSLRNAKLAEGQVCEVCGFDFSEVYGPLGDGFAEVHHLKILALRKRRSLTRMDHLSTLCSNCHRMAHRAIAKKTIPENHTLEHLKEALSPAKGRQRTKR